MQFSEETIECLNELQIAFNDFIESLRTDMQSINEEGEWDGGD